MIIDRIQGPQENPIKKIDLIQPTRLKLDNGISFYQLISGSQPVIRLEFIFDAGIRHQKKTLQAAYTNSMLLEGTKKLSAQEIAEKFDYYGAFVAPEIDNDRAAITLHCLTKNLNSVLPLFIEVILEASFPEQQLKTNLAIGLEKHIVNNDKVEFLSRKRFMQELFGSQHPYGVQAEIENYQSLLQSDLVTFYQEHYSLENLVIIASGNFDESVFKQVNAAIGQIKTHSGSAKNNINFNIPAPIKCKVNKTDALQNSIRIGRQFPNKTNSDYVAMQILNTALGGYFGSRLMTNIREDKGYTYGIGSGLVSLENAGYFFIATEVGSDVSEKALHEIYFEINRLGEEEIPEQELKMVKNYMLGSFLRHSDGPFAMADRFKAIHFYNLKYSYYDQYIERINTISASELKSLAKQYLKPELLTEVVAGQF